MRNQGPAIPRELVAVMFEPFCQEPVLRDTSHARGLGLGLYIVRQAVTDHGGTVGVESTAKQGTTFTVRLPRRSAAEVSVAHRASWDEGAASGA